jgi:hypothetical protein
MQLFRRLFKFTQVSTFRDGDPFRSLMSWLTGMGVPYRMAASLRT